MNSVDTEGFKTAYDIFNIISSGVSIEIRVHLECHFNWHRIICAEERDDKMILFYIKKEHNPFVFSPNSMVRVCLMSSCGCE